MERGFILTDIKEAGERSARKAQ